MVASQSGTVVEWSWVVVAGVVAGMVVVVVGRSQRRWWSWLS